MSSVPGLSRLGFTAAAGRIQKSWAKSQIIKKHNKQSKGKHTSLRLRDHLMPAVPWHMASVTIASPLFNLLRELSWVHRVAVSQIIFKLFMMFFMVI
jgi:hypothetical protein